MAVINTKGLTVYLSKGGVTATELVPTAITKAKPAVVTVAAVTGVTAGDVVTFETTGFPELDGKTLVVGTIDTGANTFTVVGSDTTGSTGTLGGSPKAHVHKAADQVKLCLSALDIGSDSVNQIQIGTFCNPSASVAGNPTPGTVTLSGYVDANDAGLAEIIKAAEDGNSRVFEIVLPDAANNGYLVGEISLAGFSMSVPLEGVIAFSVSGSQVHKIRWVH